MTSATSSLGDILRLRAPFFWGLSDLRSRMVDAGFWPADQLHAVNSKGQHFRLCGTTFKPQPKSTRPQAWLVDESDCFWGHFKLPAAPSSELSVYVEEALMRECPLPTDKALIAWAAEPEGSGWKVRWGVCRRASVESAIREAGLPPSTYCFLVKSDRAWPVWPQSRQQLAKRQTWWDTLGVGILVAAACAIMALATFPAALQRQAVTQAVALIDELEPQVAPLRQHMEVLSNNTVLIESLRQMQAGVVSHSQVVEALSEALPDDTWLERIDINGKEIRFTGLTNNASELLAHLSRHPQLAEVRATSASVRDNADNKERFSFEARWRTESGQ